MELIEFPCDFAIKVIGNHTDKFVTEVIAIATCHFPDFHFDNVKFNQSKHKHYIALTLTVYALDKAALDALYIELSAHPDSKMVL